MRTTFAKLSAVGKPRVADAVTKCDTNSPWRSEGIAQQVRYAEAWHNRSREMKL